MYYTDKEYLRGNATPRGELNTRGLNLPLVALSQSCDFRLARSSKFQPLWTEVL
jgi:hypothetical protein